MRAAASERRNNASRLFGYDIFVSFALGPPPRGSRSYASDLARRLRERDFTVFFSEEEAPVGDQLDHTLRRALHRSRILVVIANGGTLADPRWVRTEVEEFRRKHPERPIIPVNIGGALQDPALAAAAEPWLRFTGKIWIDESQCAGDEGIASDNVLDRLVTAPNAMRSRSRWRWTVRAAFAVLSIVTASALWFAWSDRQNARRAGAAAEEARNNAETAQRNADTARANEERARQNERRALSAEDQAQQEAEAARKAERIAQSGRLAAESQLARASDSRLALLLAAEAWKLQPTMDSRRALYEALHEPVAIPLISGGSPLESSKAVDYSADGRFIAGIGDSAFVTSVGDGQLVRVWDAETRRPLLSHRAAGRIYEIAFSPDSGMLAAATEKGLHLWNAATGEAIGEPLMVSTNVSAVAWRRDGRVLAFAGPNGIVLWDPHAKAAIGEPLRLESKQMVSQLSFSEHGNRLAVVQFDTIQVWEIATRSPQKEPLRSGGIETSVLFLSDEHLAFTARAPSGGFSRYQVTLWHQFSGQQETAFIDASEILALAHAPAAGLSATGSEDGSIRLWEGWFTRPLHTPLYGHNAAVTGLAFTPDGTRLVARSYNRLVQWLLNTGFHRFRRGGPSLPSEGERTT